MSGERTYSLTLAPVHDAGYINFYGRDVTEEKQAKEALIAAKESLEERVRERTASVRLLRNIVIAANEAATMRYRAGLESVTTIVQTVQLLANASIERTRSLVEYNTAISNLYLYAAVWPGSTYPIVEQLLNPSSSSSKPNQHPTAGK